MEKRRRVPVCPELGGGGRIVFAIEVAVVVKVFAWVVVVVDG